MSADQSLPGVPELPGNIEAEQALLGAIMVQNDAYGRVSAFLEPEHFLEPLHQQMFRIAGKMIEAGRLCNPVLIKSSLPENELIGEMTVAQYLARLAAEAVTIINAREFGLAVYEMWLRRSVDELAETMKDRVRAVDPGEDILDKIADLEERFANLRLERIANKAEPSAADEWLEGLGSAYRDKQVVGVPIVFPEIAQVLSEPCFEPGNLYGLLSSSGEGKTSLTMQIIHHAIKNDCPTLFLSFDQDRQQCIRQMAAQQIGLEVRRQKMGSLSEPEFESAVDFAAWVRKQPLEIIKCSNEKAAKLVGHARQFVRRYSNGNPCLVVVDHLKAVPPEDPRAHEGERAGAINRIFKAGATQTGAAWLVLNQRNSQGLRRQNPRPIAADLVGGEQARQDYDAVAYQYRFKKWFEERKAVAGSDREKEQIDKLFTGRDWNGVDDVAEIGAIKVRYGSPYERRQLIFDAPLTRYKPKDPPPQEDLL
ncbi:replicative DNA helicase [Oceaniradius stylonematis]|uniref:replicative DNA helicase n=1 Tax=Oceaniradius stylonematis TaxID=2184161 RepID=UPI00273D82B2|nr:DnaB-like helicase N-terminal domain-containing protein [Oceaniradius stylonematis]